MAFCLSLPYVGLTYFLLPVPPSPQRATGGLTDAQVIGAGGFGLVYKGTINGRAVAVKVLDAQSSQGDREFQAEVRERGERLKEDWSQSHA